jgi:hypothetical protein
MTSNTSGGTGAGLSTGAHGDFWNATGLTDSSSSPPAYTTKSGTIQAGGVTSCCGTGQGWNGTQAGGGVMFFFTGPAATKLGCTPAITPAPNVGTISLNANSSINLIGSPTNGTYKGILFFANRSAASQSYSIGGGNSTMTIYGTIYLTDTIAQMGLTSAATCSQNQTVSLGGTGGQNTEITGEIIVSKLAMSGNSGITMTLSSLSLTTVRQIALVNGE